MLNWDDLKYLLATVQLGSFSLAARELGVNRTTVARRVAVLEKQLAAPLLEQSSGGYQLTTAGEEVVGIARELERQVLSLEEKLSSGHNEVSGSLRVAVPLGLGPEFMPELASFSAHYPNIEIELLNTLDPMASINQRKADIGIGVGHALPDYLSGSKVANLHRAIYAAKSYLHDYSANLPVSEHKWIGWGREMANTQAALWIQRHVSDQADIRLRVNSWHALRAAVSQGIGVGHLWCFLADREKSLVKISDSLPELNTGLWVFHHGEVLHNRRINAFRAAVVELLKARIANVKIV